MNKIVQLFFGLITRNFIELGLEIGLETEIL